MLKDVAARVEWRGALGQHGSNQASGDQSERAHLRCMARQTATRCDCCSIHVQLIQWMSVCVYDVVLSVVSDCCVSCVRV